jgi:alpha-L-rhamnosidase
MHHRFVLATIVALFSLIGCNSTAHITALKCENRIDPLAVDETQPRLTWILNSPQRNVAQTAYQIIVATDPNKLNEGGADGWNTGKVASSSSSALYVGHSLHAGDHAYWRVRVWDQDDHPSAWSAPALWSVGPLSPNDWKGQWIGAIDARPPRRATGTNGYHAVESKNANEI